MRRLFSRRESPSATEIPKKESSSATKIPKKGSLSTTEIPKKEESKPDSKLDKGKNRSLQVTVQPFSEEEKKLFPDRLTRIDEILKKRTPQEIREKRNTYFRTIIDVRALEGANRQFFLGESVGMTEEELAQSLPDRQDSLVGAFIVGGPIRDALMVVRDWERCDEKEKQMIIDHIKKYEVAYAEMINVSQMVRRDLVGILQFKEEMADSIVGYSQAQVDQLEAIARQGGVELEDKDPVGSTMKWVFEGALKTYKPPEKPVEQERNSEEVFYDSVKENVMLALGVIAEADDGEIKYQFDKGTAEKQRDVRRGTVGAQVKTFAEEKNEIFGIKIDKKKPDYDQDVVDALEQRAIAEIAKVNTTMAVEVEKFRIQMNMRALAEGFLVNFGPTTKKIDRINLKRISPGAAMERERTLGSIKEERKKIIKRQAALIVGVLADKDEFLKYLKQRIQGKAAGHQYQGLSDPFFGRLSDGETSLLIQELSRLENLSPVERMTAAAEASKEPEVKPVEQTPITVKQAAAPAKPQPAKTVPPVLDSSKVEPYEVRTMDIKRVMTLATGDRIREPKMGKVILETVVKHRDEVITDAFVVQLGRVLGTLERNVVEAGPLRKYNYNPAQLNDLLMILRREIMLTSRLPITVRHLGARTGLIRVPDKRIDKFTEAMFAHYVEDGIPEMPDIGAKTDYLFAMNALIGLRIDRSLNDEMRAKIINKFLNEVKQGMSEQDRVEENDLLWMIIRPVRRKSTKQGLQLQVIQRIMNNLSFRPRHGREYMQANKMIKGSSLGRKAKREFLKKVQDGVYTPRARASRQSGRIGSGQLGSRPKPPRVERRSMSSGGKGRPGGRLVPQSPGARRPPGSPSSRSGSRPMPQSSGARRPPGSPLRDRSGGRGKRKDTPQPPFLDEIARRKRTP